MKRQKGGLFWFALLSPLIVKLIYVAKAALIAWRVSMAVARVVGTARAIQRTVQMARTLARTQRAGRTIETIRNSKTISATKGKMEKIQAAIDFTEVALEQCENSIKDSAGDANRRLEQSGQKKISAGDLISNFIDPAKRSKLIAPSFRLLWRAYKGKEAKGEVKSAVKRRQRRAVQSVQKHLPTRTNRNDFQWTPLRRKVPVTLAKSVFSSSPFTKPVSSTATVTGPPPMTAPNITSF